MNPEDQLIELDSTPLWSRAAASADHGTDSQAHDFSGEAHSSTEENAIRDRILAWDQQIVDGLRENVDPPEELKTQILAALADVAVDEFAELAGEDNTGEVGVDGVGIASPETASRMSRRIFNRWTLGIASAICLGAIAVTFALMGGTQEPLHVHQIIHAVEESLQGQVFMEVAQQGEPRDGMQVPTQYLVEGSKGFRELNLFGAPVVAHDLRLGTPVARLFVIATDQEVADGLVVGGPPVNPQSDTNGRCIGVWHSKDSKLIYVLMVHGDKDDYRRMVRHRAAA